MMLEARVNTVEAMEPTVWVEALASRRIVKSFSASRESIGSSIQSSCSYCCLLVLIQNLQTRYVTAAMAITPPITPPAIAPTLGPEPLELEGVGVVDGIPITEEATHDREGHAVQDPGVNWQIWPVGHCGQCGSPHFTQPSLVCRRRIWRSLYVTIKSISTSNCYIGCNKPTCTKVRHI